MTIFLYGPDDYRRGQKKKELIAEFQKKHSNLGISHFDLAEEGEAEKLEEFLRNQSIFEPAKLAVLVNVFEAADTALSSADLAEKLKAFARDSKTTILISAGNKPPKDLGFLAEPPVLWQEFELLKGEKWRLFVKKEAEKFGVGLSAAAMEHLARVFEGQGWRLSTELQKLSGLGKRTVEKSDLENLSLDIAPVFWEGLSNLRSRNINQCLAALQKLFGQNEPAGKVFNIISAVWPEKIAAFAAYDLAVKSGKMDYEEALLDLVIG